MSHDSESREAPIMASADIEGDSLVDCAIEIWNNNDDDWRAGKVVSNQRPRSQRPPGSPCCSN